MDKQTQLRILAEQHPDGDFYEGEWGDSTWGRKLGFRKTAYAVADHLAEFGDLEDSLKIMSNPDSIVDYFFNNELYE